MTEDQRPLLRVVRGEPTAAELAALVTVLAARAAAAAAVTAPEPPRSLWRDRATLVHAPLLPGRGAWRASGLPR